MNAAMMRLVEILVLGLLTICGVREVFDLLAP